MLVVGLDPSLSNFGMVKADLDLDSGLLTILDVVLIETKPDNKNKVERKNSQNLKRAQALLKGLSGFLKDVEMVFVEIPVGSQSARAMASYGVCLGVIASIKAPLIQVTPKEVKMSSVGSQTASKRQMIDWATNTYPHVNWFTRKTKGIESFTNKNEHLADAIAAVHAGLETASYLQLRAMMLSITKEK